MDGERNLMLRHRLALYSFLARIASALLLVLVCGLSLNTHPAQAGSGPTIVIPASNITPTMDGVCDPSEYSDATQVSITVGADHTFPIYIKRTANDAYFCFGDTTGLPLPNGGQPEVAVYIDRDDDGEGNEGDDFGIWMPYASGGLPWASYWGNGAYNGPDPGGWQAVKHQTPGVWQAEFRISHQTLGGWNHTVGLALFYHWWRWESDDYSWPANGIWASPQWWGNARFTTDSVDIGNSLSVPTMDGLCGSEYSDAATVDFTIPVDSNVITITSYLEHSPTDLFVCLSNLITPSPVLQDEPNAALYLDRTGTGGGAPGMNDLLFTISYSGIVQANSGDGSGFTGPDPGGHSVVRAPHDGVWDAEFRISGSTIGRWYSRTLGLTVAEQDVYIPGDYFGWPAGSSSNIPYSWGRANLLQLGSHNYLPILLR